MTTRFCASCMADVGLDPAHSRLALPGCTSARTAFCDGRQHNCTVVVDEHGAVVGSAAVAAPDADFRLATILTPDRALVG